MTRNIKTIFIFIITEFQSQLLIREKHFFNERYFEVVSVDLSEYLGILKFQKCLHVRISKFYFTMAYVGPQSQ